MHYAMNSIYVEFIISDKLYVEMIYKDIVIKDQQNRSARRGRR